MPLKNKAKRRAYRKQHYQKNKVRHQKQNLINRHELRKWFQEYKSKCKCNMCPEAHPACLDFHHQNPRNNADPNNNKKETVASLVHRGAAKDRILAEVAKCIPLCSNCHRKLHWVQSIKLIREY